MTQLPLVLIHGWNDSSVSLTKLANRLKAELAIQPILINLADYVSMDDDITFSDLGVAMQAAWLAHNLPTQPYSVDALVHSTGGLVIRQWLVAHYRPDQSPIKHLVMLAPANFGSHLAHKGKTFYARIIKGFDGQRMFNTGTQLLDGLELASPYTWELAMKDRFNPQPYFGQSKTLCTVLVGDTGFDGIKAAANQPGTDGAVRASTANLNCAKALIDFSQNAKVPTFEVTPSREAIAFAILPGENHNTIIGQDGGFKNSQTLKLIVDGLTQTDQTYSQWCDQLKQATEAEAQTNPNARFQNTVFLVKDHLNHFIKDYFVEFYAPDDRQHLFAQFFHQDVINTTHAYGDNPAYRSLYIQTSRLFDLQTHAWKNMSISLTAHPDIRNKKNLVGYRTYTDDDIGAIHIPRDAASTFFQNDRTLLIEIVLRREQLEQVFRLKKLN